MAQKVRRRHEGTSSPASQPRVQDEMRITPPETGITLMGLLRASPQEHGYVMKLHVPFFYFILPLFLQKIVSRYAVLSYLLGPRWERRYLVLVGNYVYKFLNDTNPRQEPKGSPVDIEAVEVAMIDPETYHGEMFVPIRNLPVGYAGTFMVSTFRKKQYYAVSHREQASVWTQTLQDSQQEAIKRRLGHAPYDSYPTHWDYFDNLGRGLVKRKDRIRARVESNFLREMEMSDLTHGGGAISRGYLS